MRLGLTRLAAKLSGTVVSLSASVLTRTSAVTAYPPTISFTRPLDWQDGDKAVMQWSTDQTFAAGVTETTTPVTLTAAVTTYNFGLSAIVAAVVYMRLGAWRASRPALLNWSNLTVVGDAVAPVISTSATQTVAELSPLAVALVANKTVSWAITGGADQLQYAITGTTLTWFGNGTENFDIPATANASNNYVVIVSATDLAGNVTPITITTSVTAVAKQPVFTPAFTAVTGATDGTVYTSNTTTVSGLAAGLVIAGTVTNFQFSKNGGAFVAAGSTTMTNGDTFALKGSTPLGSTSGVLTGSPGVHAGTATFTIADNSSQLVAATGIDRNANITTSGTPVLTYTTNGGTGTTQLVRLDRAAKGTQNYIEVLLTTVTGNWVAGLSNGTVNFNTTTILPGHTDATGVDVNGFNGVNINSGGTNVALSVYPTAGQTIGLEFDNTTLRVYNASTNALLATIAHGLGTAALKFHGGQQGSGANLSATINIGGTAFLRTPTGGFGGGY